MRKHIEELKESIKQLESEDQWLVAQIAARLHEQNQLEAEIQDLEWRRESILKMLVEDTAALAELNDKMAQ